MNRVRAVALVLLLGAAPWLSGCVARAAVATTGAVVGGAAKATGAVVGAGVDAVTTSDEEARAQAEPQARG